MDVSLLQIQFDGEKYFAVLTKDEKEKVLKAGFQWDQSIAKWVSYSDKAAYRLIDYASPSLQEKIRASLGLNIVDGRDVPKVIWATSRGQKPFDHQLQGVQWVLSRRASYLAFEAGTGKTPIAPLCFNTKKGRAIIICPSFLKLNWEYEIDQWSVDFLHIQVLKKQADVLDPRADVYIVPDSLLHCHNFREQFFDPKKRGPLPIIYLFVDEAHRFKSMEAKRTQSLVGTRRKVKGGKRLHWRGFHAIADHVVAFSGTPMPNRPLELYALISRHAPHAINYFDFHQYGVRYCDGFESEWGWDYTGNSNLDELHSLITKDYMLIKKLDDCVDLPEKMPPQFIFLEDSRAQGLVGEEMRLLNKLTLSNIIAAQAMKDEVFRQKLEDKIEDDDSMNGLGFISEIRKLLGLSKVKESVKVLKQLLDDNDKIVVFCWHKEVAAQLFDGLEDYGPLMITGDTPNTTRDNYVKAFQTSKNHRVLVANIQAAGVGITLTSSSCVVFVEASWVPSDNDQAISRCHRVGQKRTVKPYYFVVRDSLDHMILNAHQEKNQVINKAIKPR